jgi:hypothetical protein
MSRASSYGMATTTIGAKIHPYFEIHNFFSKNPQNNLSS